MTEPITLESQAVVVRDTQAVDRALSVDEIKQRLDFIKKVMHENMTEGQDYGKIPGCGDKPGLFQPGAQKLALTFQLSPIVAREVLRELRNDHREYEFTLAITTASGRVLANGVGTCSTFESKYRYRAGARKCPECGKETIIKGKAEYGGGWLCFQKKGGCGAKWTDGDKAIEGQSVERVEHDTPADFWNTVRKMAFKRALVHGMINATNTSELWSQDLEDIAENGHNSPAPEAPQKHPATQPVKTPKKGNGGTQNSLKERITGMKIKLTERFGAAGVGWAESYCRSYTVEGSDANASLMPNEGLDALSEQAVDWIALNWKKFMAALADFIEENDTLNEGQDREGYSDDQDRENYTTKSPETPLAAPPEVPQVSGPAPAEPESIQIPQGCESIKGTVELVSFKSGKSKKGDWLLCGVQIRGPSAQPGEGIWFSSFSKSIADFAKGLKGQTVELFYVAEAKGNRIVAITHNGNTVQSST